MRKIYVFICFYFLVGCQNHTHRHQHEAPAHYRHSVNQQMHLPFHIEQKYENSASSSNDFELNVQPPIPKSTIPQKQVRQNAKK